MNKILLVIFAVLCISATAKFKLNTKGDIDFFLGFSSVFGLESAAQSLLACAGKDSSAFTNDLRKTISDLGKGKINPAFSDFVHLLDDVHELQKDCPAGAQPFVKKFGPVVEAWKKSPTNFYKAVGRNLAANPVGTFKTTVKLTLDIKRGDFRTGGQDFGSLAQIALNNYLGSSNIVFALDYFGQQYELEGDSISSNNALDFFYGFSNAFGLGDAAHKLVQCGGVEIPALVSAIQSLVGDIKKSRWGQVVTDGIAIYMDIQPMAADCPAGAVPFINEFAPVVEAFHHDQSAFMTRLGKNVAQNLPSLMFSVGKLVQDFKQNKYVDAGAQFGNILHTTLNGYVQF